MASLVSDFGPHLGAAILDHLNNIRPNTSQPYSSALYPGQWVLYVASLDHSAILVAKIVRSSDA